MVTKAIKTVLRDSDDKLYKTITKLPFFLNLHGYRVHKWWQVLHLLTKSTYLRCDSTSAKYSRHS